MMADCTVCGNTDIVVFTLGQARRAWCPECKHEKRIDIETFDYADFAMGATGASQARLRDQAVFLERHLLPDRRILELGCATGRLAGELRARLKINAYHGIELSPARKIAARNLDTLYDAPLPELLRQGRMSGAKYDAVITSHCLEHIEDINTEIATIRTVLAHDGRLYQRP